MKKFAIILALLPLGSQATQLQIQVAPEVAQYLRTLKVSVSHVSTESGKGCVIRGFLDDRAKVFSQTYSLNTAGGIVDVPASLTVCSAKLASILIDGKQITSKVSQAIGGSAANDMDRYSVTIQPNSASETLPVECKISRRFVAGREQPQGQLTCTNTSKTWFDPSLTKIVLKIKLAP